VTALLTLTGWCDLLATVALAGGFLYAATIAVPAPAGRRWRGRAAGVLAAVLVAEFGLTAYRMHEVSGMSGLSLAVHLLDTHWGRWWIVRAAGLAVLVGAAGRARPLAVVAALWLLPRSFQGHPGAHGTIPALIDWLHLLAAATWIGGLVQLSAVPDPLPTALAERFRSVATGTLAALLPSGVYGAFLHVPNLHALTTSPYGRTLVLKLIAVSVLLGLAAANHFRHVPALARGEHGSAAVLKRTIIAEIALGAGVLLLSALLGVLPMPHELPPGSP
jgi:putative copper export protein